MRAFILCLFFLEGHAFLCTMVDRSFFASFPKVPVERGLRLLHAPEEWGNGPCLAFGVSRYHTRNITGRLLLHKETMQQFYAGDMPVTFIAQGTHKVSLRVPFEDITVDIRLTEYTPKVGFSLYVTISGLPAIPDREMYMWSKGYRSLVETTLFSLEKEPFCCSDVHI